MPSGEQQKDEKGASRKGKAHRPVHSIPLNSGCSSADLRFLQGQMTSVAKKPILAPNFIMCSREATKDLSG